MRILVGISRAVALGAALVGVCVVALSAGGVAGASAGSAHSAGGVSESIHWGACDPPGPDLQCARIRVPLDWDRPHGRTINLALARHLASKPDERIGTAFIDPGGPGDTGVGLVTGDPEGVDAIGGGRFDVVGWDPRGAQGSTRVRCFKSRRAEDRFWAGASFPTTRSQAKRAERRGAAVARRCGEVSGWLLPHISTADTARDLDHLRALMGEEKMTYIGLSYGSYIGQTYANLFPDRVRAIVLNGNVDPVRYARSAEARIAMWAEPADDVLREFLSLCDAAGPERCALAGGDEPAAERWDRLRALAKRDPIPAPAANGTSLSRSKLSYGDLLISQFQPFRAPRTWPDHAADLAAALRGNASALEDSAGFFTSAAGWSSGTTSSAIQCADAPARKRPGAWLQVFKRQKRLGPLTGAVHFAWEWATCASWPVRGEDAYRGPWNAVTPNPILVVNQTHDPNGSYANAVAAEKLLGNAVLLTHEGYGHLWFQDPSTCVDEAMADYLTELITPPRGTVCQSDHQPFDPDFGQPNRMGQKLRFGRSGP